MRSLRCKSVQRLVHVLQDNRMGTLIIWVLRCFIIMAGDYEYQKVGLGHRCQLESKIGRPGRTPRALPGLSCTLVVSQNRRTPV